jgi:trans-aconitate methyltransferase
MPGDAPKPAGLGPEYGGQFKDESVVRAYAHRPPPSSQICEVLDSLIVDRPATMLDIGCGRGEIARMMTEFLERVDAVDFSPGMIEQGRKMVYRDRPNIRWICASAETAPLEPPYAVVTAGSSLHWMDWSVVLPRLAGALSRRGMLVIFNDGEEAMPWSEELGRIIPKYSTNREFESYDLVEELSRRDLFEKRGERTTVASRFVQSVEDYVESFHARNGFSRERMTRENAAAFDQAVREAVGPWARDGKVHLEVFTTIVWGKPLSPKRR